MTQSILLVALGGGVGSVLRYLLGTWFARQVVSGFPWGTFFVNMTGCLLIGLLYGWLTKSADNSLKLLLLTGFCGGYTTFSAFALENINLIQNGAWLQALLYMILSLFISLLAVIAGILLVS